MNIGVSELMLLMVILGILPIWGIIDAALRPDDAWARTNQNKVVWILVQFFLGAVGAVVYFAAIRPKLKAATPELSST